jgi:hypothetical protein
MPISLKTGSGGLPVSAILPLNSTQTIYTPEEGGVWLRSGTITDDLTTYPKATPNLAAFFDNFFEHASELTNARTVVTDGTDFWVIDGVARIAYKYDSAGAYTGTSVSIATTMSNPEGGIWDGTNYWVTDTIEEVVVQYDSSFSATGTEFDISAEIPNNAQGLAWDGTYFYIASNTDNLIFRYDAAGAYTGFSFSFGSETTNVKDLEFFDGFLWLMEASGKTFKYNLDGEYIGDFFEVVATSETTDPYAITSDSESFWIGGSNNSIVSQFTSYAGIAFLASDTDSGKPLYVKVA